MKKTLIAALWLLFSAAPAFAAPLPVVASFSILGDMVKTIGGEDVTVGPGLDRGAAATLSHGGSRRRLDDGRYATSKEPLPHASSRPDRPSTHVVRRL